MLLEFYKTARCDTRSRYLPFLGGVFASLFGVLYTVSICYSATVTFPEFLPGQSSGAVGSHSITYTFDGTRVGQFESSLFQEDVLYTPIVPVMIFPGMQQAPATFSAGFYGKGNNSNAVCLNESACGAVTQLQQLGIDTQVDVSGTFTFGDKVFPFHCGITSWGMVIDNGDWRILCNSSLMVHLDFKHNSQMASLLGLPECASVRPGCAWTRVSTTQATVKISYVYNGDAKPGMINLPISVSLPENDGWRQRIPFSLGTDTIKVSAGSCTVSSLPNEINFDSVSSVMGSTSEVKPSIIQASCSYSPDECPDCSGERNALVRVKSIDNIAIESGIPLYQDESQKIIGFVNGSTGDNAVSCSNVATDPLFHSGVQFPLLLGGNTTVTTVNWIACANGQGFGATKGNALIEVVLP